MKSVMKFIWSLITNRLFILAIVLVVLFYTLILQLFELQIIQGADLNEAFSLRVIREREIEGQRGLIFDRNGYPLAENILAYTVQLDGSIYVEDQNKMLLDLTNIIEADGDEVVSGFPIGYDVNHNFTYIQSDADIANFKRQVFNNGRSVPLTNEQNNMSVEEMFYYVRDEIFEIPAYVEPTEENLDEENLDGENLDGEVIGYTDEEVLKILNIRYPLWLTRYSQYQLSTVAYNISDKTLSSIVENNWKFPGVTIIEDPLRYYNDAEYFSHIIGYTSAISSDTLTELEAYGYNNNDVVGVTGIEKVMELNLHGNNGVETVEVDNLGRTMNSLTIENPSVGNDIYLTIDKDLQIEAQDILEKQIANILQTALVYNKPLNPRNSDDNVNLLMKDVFISIVNRDLLSMTALDYYHTEKGSSEVYDAYKLSYDNVKDKITVLLTKSELGNEEKYQAYIDYLLSVLVADGYLTKDYKDLSSYDQYIKGEINFTTLISSFINGTYITLHESDNTDNIENFIMNRLLNDYTNYYEFKKMVLVGLLDDEDIEYRYLCMMLQEQGITEKNDETYEALLSQDLSPLEYMKAIILNLEITPAELALDPSSGSVVVVDVNTGEVLAMVSYPSYDNNKFANTFDYSYYLQLINNPTTPMFPRATQSKTAPGSTFKMVSAFAGLVNGVIDVDTKIVDLGLFTKISPPAQCWIYANGGTHGSINVTKAIEVSCNYFFYEVGYRLSFDEDGDYVSSLGLEKLNAMASNFGLDQHTGLELPDLSSTLSTVDPSRTAIGQSENNYTPVQMARYVATVANGGTLYELNIIDKVSSPSGNLIEDTAPIITKENNFEEDHIAAVQAGMLAVTEGSSGSAKSYFYNFPIHVAGKTGTAQESETRPPHSYFVSYAPFDNPEIAVVAVVPFGYGSAKAIPIGRDIIAAYYELYETKTPYSTDFMLDE